MGKMRENFLGLIKFIVEDVVNVRRNEFVVGLGVLGVEFFVEIS